MNTRTHGHAHTGLKEASHAGPQVRRCWSAVLFDYTFRPRTHHHVPRLCVVIKDEWKE